MSESINLSKAWGIPCGHLFLVRPKDSFGWGPFIIREDEVVVEAYNRKRKISDEILNYAINHPEDVSEVIDPSWDAAHALNLARRFGVDFASLDNIKYGAKDADSCVKFWRGRPKFIPVHESEGVGYYDGAERFDHIICEASDFENFLPGDLVSLKSGGVLFNKIESHNK